MSWADEEFWTYNKKKGSEEKKEKVKKEILDKDNNKPTERLNNTQLDKSIVYSIKEGKPRKNDAETLESRRDIQKNYQSRRYNKIKAEKIANGTYTERGKWDRNKKKEMKEEDKPFLSKERKALMEKKEEMKEEMKEEDKPFLSKERKALMEKKEEMKEEMKEEDKPFLSKERKALMEKKEEMKEEVKTENNEEKDKKEYEKEKELFQNP